MPDPDTVERCARAIYEEIQGAAPSWTDDNLPDNETREEAELLAGIAIAALEADWVRLTEEERDLILWGLGEIEEHANLDSSGSESVRQLGARLSTTEGDGE